MDNNKPQPVVFTGALADYGTTVTVNAQGKADQNGNYVRVTLKRGSFTVNISALNSASNNSQPSINSSTCSGSDVIGPEAVPIVAGSGSGSYQGLGGTLNLTLTEAFIGPKKNGSCNQNANPIASWGTVTGSGTLS